MKKSIFGNLRYNNASNTPKKILHLNFDYITLGATTFVTTKNYNKSITPENLNASVVNAFFGSGYTLQIQSICDVAVASAAEFDAIIENSIVSVTGPASNNISALLQNIKSKDLAPGTNPSFAPNQTWVRLLRNHPGGAPASDIDTLYVSSWHKVQIPPADELATFLDYSDPSGLAFWLALREFKTGGYGGTPGAGDYRVSFRIEEGASGLYWSVRGDDRANNAAVPGVPVDINNRQHWRVDCASPVPPSDTWFKLETLIERGRAENRTLAIVTINGVRSVICDKRSSGDLLGVADAQEGVQRLPWSQMFFAGLYADSLSANYPLNQQVADIQVWDSAPHNMEYIETGNHGPLPWVPTPLSKGTMFGAADGNDANPGTEASPKTYQGAVNAAVNPGDVVFFRGGTLALTTAAHFSLWNVGTAAQPIIYEVYPSETFIIDGSAITPGVGNQRRVNFSDSYQKLRGVIIQNMPEYGVYNGGTHNTVDGCEIRDCKLSGISNTGSYNTFINNYIHGCSDAGYPAGNYANGGNADGVSISSGTGNYVGHNRVIGCSDDGIDSWQSLYTRIEYNIVSGNGLGDGNGNGIKAGGNSTGANALVKNNLVYNNVANGIDANTGINVTFRNNTSYSNGGEGYVLETDTIAIENVSSDNGTIKTGTGVPERNSWDISGTLTFISTTEGNPNFLKVTQGGAFDGIGWEYI